MNHKITLSLTDDEYQNLHRLAAYCGYLRQDKRLRVSEALAFLQAVATLPPDKWDELASLLGRAASGK